MASKYIVPLYLLVLNAIVWVSGWSYRTAAEIMAVHNDYITKSTRPSRFFACNIEKHGKGRFIVSVVLIQACVVMRDRLKS